MTAATYSLHRHDLRPIQSALYPPASNNPKQEPLERSYDQHLQDTVDNI